MGQPLPYTIQFSNPSTTSTVGQVTIVSQLGPNLDVCRGPLVRQSLQLQNVPLPDDAYKLAWLAHHLPRFDGSGIVYALTVSWTERIAEWLWERLAPTLPGLSKVVVRETCTAGVEFTGPAPSPR